MATPSIPEVRDQVETDLTDSSVQDLIDAAYEEITSRFGSDNSQVDELDGRVDEIWPSRVVDSITEVVETVGTTETTLASDDYRLAREGRSLRRLSTGTNPGSFWAPGVKVTYAPQTDARRKQVAIKLVQLEIENKGTASERVGDYSSVAVDIEAQRKKLLAPLKSKTRMVA